MSNTKRSSSPDIKKLVYIAVFTALVVVLQFVPIKIGTFELALSVPVIIIGAAVCGTGAGTWLGLAFGIVVLCLPGTTAFLGLNAFGTVLTVILKGMLTGLVAALVYKAFARVNRYLASLVSAIAATFTNTGIFLIGSLLFFDSDLATVVSVFISVNFLIELAVNVVMVPTVYKLINITKKV